MFIQPVETERLGFNTRGQADVFDLPRRLTSVNPVADADSKTSRIMSWSSVVCWIANWIPNHPSMYG